MADGKKSNDAPPFATRDGKPSGGAGGSQGGKGPDFTRETNSQSAPVPGRDFTKESRDQSQARPEVMPAKGEIPAGGKDLKADPSGKSGNTGDTEGVAGRAPFRNLK